MKYIYTNVTPHFQACHLASKNQEHVSIKTFGPGGAITLDYPGLNMYVPSVLSCVAIDVTFEEVVVPVIVEPPPFVLVIDPVFVEPELPSTEEIPLVEPLVEVPPAEEPPLAEIHVEVPPAPVVKVAAKKILKKTIKKTKK